MGGVTAVAHRGDPYRVRENTLPSFTSAAEAGADAVEFDVRLTADGVPVVVHDATLDRLWGHQVSVAAVTAAEVRRLTGGGVPTLTAALAHCAELGVRALLDLPERSASDAQRVVEVARAADPAARVWYCGDPGALRAVRRADPDAEIALTWKRTGGPRPSLLAEVRPRWLNYRLGLVNAETVRRAADAGYQVSAWTADSRRTMRRLRDLGATVVMSNRIGVLRSVLDERRDAGAR
ncbi:glycerophosphodiester phosphodiesterase [Streptomyces sp. DSM 44915]|uniref:Glycerophosphodiester phosphodiesterase n=1 Tax=Streptomyces chisholmiae TaxID=3075540 RepID=A0ABU2JXR1_9ACTN|nr:glycerophosphodiester phosphodiesterase [Streptomyces sp. DSM 44915]MDT0269314.1 glycerophosphodiester phosphodiesterase [Streptomyces sp. DSM 44915]